MLVLASEAVQNNLYNLQNYIKYESFFMYPINTIKWAIVGLFYGLANFSSKVLGKIIGTDSFITKGLTGKGQLAPWMNGARTAAWAILAAYLVWVGVKMVISKEPPKIKNVLLQLVTSVFLILSMGSITTMLVTQSVSWYNNITGVSESSKKPDSGKDKGKTSTKDSLGTGSLPYDVIHSNTNDVQYIISTDFGTLTKDKKKAAASKNPLDGHYGKVMDKVPKVKYGYNVLTKSQLDQGKVQLDEILNWKNIDLKSNILDMTGTDTDLGKADKKKFDDLKEDWQDGKHLSLRMLWYQLETYVDEDGKTQIESPDIGRIGTTIFAFGGYPRFEVDFWPTVITLAAITVAYFFAGYAIIKSFLELGLMNVLGIFIFAVDLDSGNKTKQVVQAIFSTSLLAALQGFEIAFYQIAMSFGQTAKNNGTFGTGITAAWAYVLFALVATTMLITGSQRVTDFFGVDTGAQHGMRGLGSAMYAASKIGHGVKRAATSPFRAYNSAKNMRDSLGHALNTEGSMKRDAKKQAQAGARQDAINKLAGIDANGNKVNSAGSGGVEKINDLNAARGQGGQEAAEERLDDASTAESPIDQKNEEAGTKTGNGIQQTPAAKKAMEKAYAKAQKTSDHAQRNARARSALAKAAMTAAGLSAAESAAGARQDAEQLPSSMTTGEAQKALEAAGVSASPATQAAMAKVDKAQAAYDQAVQNGDANAPQLKQKLDGAKQELAQSTASDIQNAQLPSSMSTGEAQKALEAAGVSASPATQAAMAKVDKAQATYDQAVQNGDPNAPQLKQELDGAKQELAQSTASDIQNAQLPSSMSTGEAQKALEATGVSASPATQAAMAKVDKAQAAYDQAVQNGDANAPQLKQKLDGAKQELAQSTASDIQNAQLPSSMSTGEAQKALEAAGVSASPATQAAMAKVDKAQATYDQAVQNGDPNAPQLKQKLDGAKQELAQSTASDIQNAQLPSSMTTSEAQKALEAAGVSASPATQAAMAKVDKAQAVYDQAVQNGDPNAPQLKQKLDDAKQELAQSTASDIQNAQLPSSMTTSEAQKALEAAGVSASPATQVAMAKVDKAQAVYDQAVANGDPNASQLRQKLDDAKQELAQSTASDIKAAQGMPAAPGISVNEARRALSSTDVAPSPATQAAMAKVEQAQKAYDQAASNGTAKAPQLKQELASAKRELAQSTARDIKAAPASGVDGATAQTMLKQAGVAPSRETSQLIKQAAQVKTEWQQAVASGNANAPQLKQQVDATQVQLAKSVNQDIGSAVAGKATVSQSTQNVATGTSASSVSQKVTQAGNFADKQVNVHQDVTQTGAQNVQEHVRQNVQSKIGSGTTTTSSAPIKQTATTGQAASSVSQKVTQAGNFADKQVNVHQDVTQTGAQNVQEHVRQNVHDKTTTTSSAPIKQTATTGQAASSVSQKVTQAGNFADKQVNVHQDVIQTGAQNVQEHVRQNVHDKIGSGTTTTSNAPIKQTSSAGMSASSVSQNVERDGQGQSRMFKRKNSSDAPRAKKETNGTNVNDFSMPKSPTDDKKK